MPTRTPEPEVTFPGTPYEGRTPASVRNTLYGQALQEVRNRHEDEFFEIVDDLFKAYGLKFNRRLTDAQKAEQQVRALLSANPDLLDKVADLFPQGEVETVGDYARSLTEES